MIQDVFTTVDVYNKALNAATLKHEAIAMNIANNDTPNYKRQDVVFESILQDAMAMNNNDIDKININSLNPKMVTDNTNLSYRMDGNNVNIDTETIALAQNQLKYNMMIQKVTNEFSKLSSAMKTS